MSFRRSATNLAAMSFFGKKNPAATKKIGSVEIEGKIDAKMMKAVKRFAARFPARRERTCFAKQPVQKKAAIKVAKAVATPKITASKSVKKTMKKEASVTKAIKKTAKAASKTAKKAKTITAAAVVAPIVEETFVAPIVEETFVAAPVEEVFVAAPVEETFTAAVEPVAETETFVEETFTAEIAEAAPVEAESFAAAEEIVTEFDTVDNLVANFEAETVSAVNDFVVPAASSVESFSAPVIETPVSAAAEVAQPEAQVFTPAPAAAEVNPFENLSWNF